MRTSVLADDPALTSDAEKLVYQLVAKLVDDTLLNDASTLDADNWRTLAEAYELLIGEYFRSRSPLPHDNCVRWVQAVRQDSSTRTTCSASRPVPSRI